jgi:hypothetical protein
MSLERCNWFDSDLCILEPINSMQLTAFEQRHCQKGEEILHLGVRGRRAAEWRGRQVAWLRIRWMCPGHQA